MANYEQRFYPQVLAEDLPQLAKTDPALVDAALTAVDELAGGHKTGKALGQRHVSGDLTGLLRLRFDPPGVWPQRYRVVFRLVDDVLEVVALGERQDHAIYRATVGRVGPPPTGYTAAYPGQ